MDIKSTILIIIAILDVISGLILIINNSKSAINVSFAMVLLSGGMWCFTIAMFIIAVDMNAAISWMRLDNLSAAIIVMAFLAFSNYFVYQLYELNFVKFIYFLIPFLFITFVIFHPTLLIDKVSHFEWGNEPNNNLLGHAFYAIYLLSYIVLSYKILFRKLKNADGINRINLLLIIIITLISYTIGLFFNLILPLMNNNKLIWFGPIFSSLVSFLIIYLIFFRKLGIKN